MESSLSFLLFAGDLSAGRMPRCLASRRFMSAITGKKSKVPISLGCEYKVEVGPWGLMDGCPGLLLSSACDT